LYQIFLPAILIALGLGLIQSGVSLVSVDYQLSTAQFNVKKFGDQNAPAFPLVTPNYRFKPVNGSAYIDAPAIDTVFSSGILKSNTSLDTMYYTAANAISIPDTYGFLAKQPQSVAGEPTFLVSDVCPQHFSMTASNRPIVNTEPMSSLRMAQ
jgi:hypothetical protein